MIPMKIDDASRFAIVRISTYDHDEFLGSRYSSAVVQVMMIGFTINCRVTRDQPFGFGGA